MTRTIEVNDDLWDRIDEHREKGQSHEEFVAELVAIYETEAVFLQEGYSE